MVSPWFILCVALVSAGIKLHRWRAGGELYRLMQVFPRLYVAIYYALIAFDVSVTHATRTQMSRYGYLLLFVPEIAMAGYQMYLKVKAWTQRK